MKKIKLYEEALQKIDKAYRTKYFNPYYLRAFATKALLEGKKIKDLQDSLLTPQFNPPYEPINECEVINMTYCDV